MSNDAVLSGTLDTEEDQRDRGTRTRLGQRDAESGQAVAVSITKAASKQTYYTIRFLVDRNRVAHAYRAYAYFRWVDDWLDRKTVRKSDRVAFAQRQRALIDCGYRGEWRDDLTCEEQLLMELTGSDQEQNSGLQCYIRNMMAVMAFDAERKGG